MADMATTDKVFRTIPIEKLDEIMRAECRRLMPEGARMPRPYLADTDEQNGLSQYWKETRE